MERRDPADEQVRHSQHAVEKAGAVELNRVKPAATQPPGQISNGKVLVPAFDCRDVADQAVGIADVSTVVFRLRMPPAVVPAVQPWESEFEIAHIQNREHVPAGNGDDQHTIVRQDAVQFVQQFFLLIDVFEDVHQRDRRERRIRERQRRGAGNVDDLQSARGLLCPLDGPTTDVDTHQALDSLGLQRPEESPVTAAEVEMGLPAGGHMLPRECIAVPCVRVVGCESCAHTVGLSRPQSGLGVATTCHKGPVLRRSYLPSTNGGA